MSKQKTDQGRRAFIKSLGVAGGAAAVVAASGEAAAEVSVAEKQETTERQGYRKSAHVRAYYDSARI